MVSLNGVCPLAEPEMMRRVEALAPPSSFPGDFVLACERSTATGGHEELVLTSGVAATPYYYHFARGSFTHGATVFEVAQRARLPWRWNSRAVNSRAVFEHTVGSDTLHADILRAEPSSRYHWHDGRLEISRDDAIENAFLKREDLPLEHTLAAARESCADLCREKRIAISLSAGYDSRALLAMALEQGASPTLHTMGSAAATDVRIAASIARDFSLSHDVVPVFENEYLAKGREIAAATSGEKSAAHWHTYIFASKASIAPGTLHLAGSNGELARSYFFDKGALARLLDILPCPMETPFLHLKYGLGRKWRGPPPRSFLASDNDRDGVTAALACAAASFAGPRGLLRRMDRFYTMERVRHFIGQGLAAYSRFLPTASPFLDSRFVRSAARLGRRWKLNSGFHRALIGATCPRLLAHPVDESGVPMRETGQAGYWRRRSKEVSYSPLPALLASAPVREIVLESPYLDTFLPRESREELLRTGQRQFLCFLLNMHFTSENVAALPAKAD
jgi:asparagine synthase (glutamine-hydrolysing)